MLCFSEEKKIRNMLNLRSIKHRSIIKWLTNTTHIIRHSHTFKNSLQQHCVLFIYTHERALNLDHRIWFTKIPTDHTAINCFEFVCYENKSVLRKNVLFSLRLDDGKG